MIGRDGKEKSDGFLSLWGKGKSGRVPSSLKEGKGEGKKNNPIQS